VGHLVNATDRMVRSAGTQPPLSRASARRIVTVIPETSGMPAGTSVIRMRTGTRCASRTQPVLRLKGGRFLFP
jgi:hypothetical protein